MPKSSPPEIILPSSPAHAATPRALAIFDVALPVLGATIAAMLVLRFLNFGAHEVWAPFAQSGPAILRALVLSGLAGGLASAMIARRLDGPLAAMGCALGWALWGWSLHWVAQGKYLEFLPGGLPGGVPASLVFANTISQSLCVAFGILIASAVSWFWVRRSQKFGAEPDNVSDDDRAGNGLQSFSTAVIYPLSTAIGGVFLLIIFGLLALPLGEPRVEQLPSGPGVALWCGLLTMVALGVATSWARRAFRAIGSIGDVVVAPIAVALVGIIVLLTRAQSALIKPAALLLWHTSAFEIASWAVLGAALGFYFARAQTRL